MEFGIIESNQGGVLRFKIANYLPLLYFLLVKRNLNIYNCDPEGILQSDDGQIAG